MRCVGALLARWEGKSAKLVCERLKRECRLDLTCVCCMPERHEAAMPDFAAMGFRFLPVRSKKGSDEQLHQAIEPDCVPALVERVINGTQDWRRTGDVDCRSLQYYLQHHVLMGVYSDDQLETILKSLVRA